MAKLTPDATRTEHGLVINEKIIPWGAVWPKDSGAYKKGAQYKADRLLSGGTGKVKGVTIHNTNDLKNVEEDAEQYRGDQQHAEQGCTHPVPAAVREEWLHQIQQETQDTAKADDRVPDGQERRCAGRPPDGGQAGA